MAMDLRMDIKNLCTSGPDREEVSRKVDVFTTTLVKVGRVEESRTAGPLSHVTSIESSLGSGDEARSHETRPFKCEMCDRTYSTKGNLVVHLRTVHFGEKRFPCEHCKRGFATKFGRDRHMHMVHLNERPFRCSSCEKTFKTKNCVRRHVRLSHDT
uniref:C2H2-type domain-containing protein n=1 Tax=Rhodosorus marinus TaxID=101924 RepID=A0A7S0BTM7_9RHOD|mmetsp:Transcript_7148/g.10606  ORF Transcript_7148/g.10606 Transcript_7148/m.10606 type:complete len:156 (+) Transcript_7148:252-719(+)